MVLLLVPVLVILMYILLLPGGAVRFAVLRSGHPVSAFVSGLEETSYGFELEDGQIGYMLTDPPYDREKGEKMQKWIVYRNGMIYVAIYDTGD